MMRPAIVLWVLLFTTWAWAQTDFGDRKARAAADARLAASWMAKAYQVPERVPQEMLFAGYSYAETIVALALMGEGASLNEVLELRRLRGGKRWREIAEEIRIDPDHLPEAVKAVLWFGRNDAPPDVLHFLPDVYPGLVHDLKISAFEPTVPSEVLVKRFDLSEKEVKDIRAVLDDPFGVPDEMLTKSAGRGLITADWVMAGVLAHHKPLPMESMLAARVGQDLPWNEVTLAFGLRPDVLTQGPLSGVYPLLTGSSKNTVLTARRRTRFPRQLSLHYDLERLTPGERRALAPLLYSCYKASQSEVAMLNERNLELAETGIALALARNSELELDQVLVHLDKGESFSDVITRFHIDMTGQDAVLASIRVRE